MARKPAADKDKSGRDDKPKRRRKASSAGLWRLPPLPWIMRAGTSRDHSAAPLRILCAGLTEGFLLAAHLPDSEVVVIARDPEAVKTARTSAARKRLRHLRIEEAVPDQPALGELVGGNFDLVLAHDVLHLAKDADLAFVNLATACAENGTVCVSLRSAAHPSSRLDAGLRAFGLARGELTGDDRKDDDEAAARLLAGLGGFMPANTRDFPHELRGEGIGPAPLAAWLDRAGAAGLNLRATTLAAKTLPGALAAGDTKLLSSFPLSKLAVLLDAFLAPSSVELVFSRETVPQVPWGEPDLLTAWRPISRFLPLNKLQPMQAPWNGLAGIEVEIRGVLAPQKFTLSNYLVEVIRRSDGTKSIADLMSEIPHETDLTDLVGALHFLHHTFILELQAPSEL